MWFRSFLISWSLLFAVFLVWMATHKSTDPEILGRYSLSYFGLLGGIAIMLILSLCTHTGYVFKHLKKREDKITLLFFSFVMSFAVTEAAARIFDPLGISYFKETTRYHLDKISDPDLVYIHKPGLKKMYQGVEVSINKLGLRNQEINKNPNAGLTLLMLGDSITFGWGVPEKETFTRQLKGLLEKHLHREVTTINSGVGSYNTFQQSNLLDKYGDLIQPDIVCLLYNSNDIIAIEPPFDPWSKRSLRGKSPTETIDLLLRKSWIFRLCFHFPHALNTYARESEPRPGDTRSNGWIQSMESLRKISTICKKINIPFITFYYQGVGGFTRLDQSLLADITAIGKELKFPVFTVKAYHDDTEIRDVVNSRIDPHPNRHGHKIIANSIANRLLENRLIPE